MQRLRCELHQTNRKTAEDENSWAQESYSVKHNHTFSHNWSPIGRDTSSIGKILQFLIWETPLQKEIGVRDVHIRRQTWPQPVDRLAGFPRLLLFNCTRIINIGVLLYLSVNQYIFCYIKIKLLKIHFLFWCPSGL